VRCTANSTDGGVGFGLINVTMSDSVASNNLTDSGIQATDSTLIHNAVKGNFIGLNLFRSVFGSNIIVNNGNDLSLNNGALSQNNNLCTNGPC